jgi:hypothetical protein
VSVREDGLWLRRGAGGALQLRRALRMPEQLPLQHRLLLRRREVAMDRDEEAPGSCSRARRFHSVATAPVA